MSLDMYLYHVYPADISASGSMEKTSLEQDGYSVMTMEEWKNEGEKVSALTPYAAKARLLIRTMDFQKLRKDHGIPESAHLTACRVRPGGTYWCYSWKDRISGEETGKDVFVTSRDQKLYETDCMQDCMVIKKKEIASWNNAYRLRSRFHRLVEKSGMEVENCGYYPVPVSFLKKLKLDGVYADPVPDLAGGMLFYHEWY